MAPPDQTKIPEQQLSNSDHTMPPTLTPGDSPGAERAQEGVQGNNETIPTQITHSSDTEVGNFEQSQGEPILDDSHPTVTDVAAGAVEQQQQDPRENDANLSIPETKRSASKLASDDDKRSVYDDGETKTGDNDGDHADGDDSNSFDSDQEEEIDLFTDDMFEPIHPTSEKNPDHVPENGTASDLVEEEGNLGNQ